MERCVLVIDDDPGVRESLSLAFGEFCRVSTASSAAQGLAFMKQHAAHLVILDHCLPDGPGTQTIHTIKTGWPSIPVVVITGYGSETVCAQFFRLGARGYFSKPYDLNALVRTVQELLALPKKRYRRNVLASFLSPSHQEDLPTAHPGIDRALSWIHAHYAESVSMKNAAKEAGLSPCHFSRLFKGAAGVGYRDYLTRYRVEKAKELLRCHQLNATEVAFATGFVDYSSFYGAFRRMTGQGPRTWRRALATNSAPATLPM